MDHLIDDEELPRHERELTLSTGSILGIFLGLVVLCGAFFGFGYNMGRKSAPTPLNMAEVTSESTLPVATPAAKPAAGSSLDESTPAPVPAPRPVRHTPPPAPAPEVSATATPETTPKPARTVTPPATPAPVVRQPAPVSPSALSPSATPATAGSGTYMVQVAAVSHQEDATLLLGALRARGYAVSARNNTGDSFIHIQVGPFHDKKEADAMRQRLLTDGYNAIVKQ